jgi:hypothetical protein
MDKRALLDLILARLDAELKAITAAALATHAEATDEENKAEDKYDTRGLEASYLAHGQSKAAEEAAEALAQFRALPTRNFGPGEPIALGALVRLEDRSCYFFGPRAGGSAVEFGGESIMIVTPQSPLGRQLLGRRQGDRLELSVGPRRTATRISSVA